MDLFRERHRQSVGHLRREGQLWTMAWLVFMDWVISYTLEWEGYSNYFGEVRIFRNLATAYSFCCCCSFAQSCLNLCDPMDCSTPGFSVLHHLLELAQAHVHWVGNAIQLSGPLSSPSFPAFYLRTKRNIPTICRFANSDNLMWMIALPFMKKCSVFIKDIFWTIH